jgi:hypothetical protein
MSIAIIIMYYIIIIIENYRDSIIHTIINNIL